MKKLFAIVLFLVLLLNAPSYAAKDALLEVSDTVPLKLKEENEGIEYGKLSKRDRIISKSSRKIDAIYPSTKTNKLGISFPGNRGPNQLVIYKREYGRRTLTNEFGKEAVVVGDKVVRLTGADSIIPHDGFVISGHGSAKKWISDNLKVGTKVKIDAKNNVLHSFTTIDSYRYCAKIKIAEVEQILDKTKKQYKNRDDKKVKEFLKKAKKELKRSCSSNSAAALQDAKNAIASAQIALSYTLPYLENELKGVWVRPTEKSEAEIERTLNEMAQLGINTIFLETYFHGKTIFPSEVMKSYGFEGQNKIFRGFDPLSCWVRGAHKRNMTLHVWFESFYIGNKLPQEDAYNILAVRPTWGNRNKENNASNEPVAHISEHRGYFIDPANPEVVDFLTKLILEICARYNIDGVNLDYVRYPVSAKATSSNYAASNWGYTPYAREEFKKIYGIDPVEISANSAMWNKWDMYRQDRITKYVANIKDALKDRGVVLSAVIFPDYKTSLETKQQNWQRWSSYNYVDALTPLILTADYNLADNMLDELRRKTSSRTKIYPGLFVGFMEGESEDLLKQIHIIRNRNLEGVVLFDWAHMDKKYSDVLRTSVFKAQCSEQNKK
ncbi:TPA: family 10 glycosylhydrolase [Candidatus Galligastranaerophilus faecipullorum]|nr:family 10 glycosylhydrolase [Candidatus Galligastranaerophilus faecipullorum]